MTKPRAELGVPSHRWRPPVALAAALALVMLVAVPSTALAAEPLPDLAPVTIGLGDLPPGFIASDDRAASFVDLAHAFVSSSTSSPDAQDRNAVVYERRAGTDAEFVVAILIAPISEADQVAFDASMSQADRQITEAAGTLFADAEVTVIEGMRTGESRFAVKIVSAAQGVSYESVAARRGPVIEVVGHAWLTGSTTTVTLADLARTLDGRLAAVVGFAAPVFRPSGPLVPELTTHIPTPLDVSTDPTIVGTNLALSALALLLLTVSAKLATRMLAEHEETISRRVPIVRLVERLEARIGAGVHDRVRGRTGELLQLLGITLFYGLVFSLLEPSWNPLTAAGAWLFVSFTITNAVVGLADDLVQWRVARRWQLPASLAVRPTNALLAVASTGVSRAAAVIPGLMFGTPEALQLDEAAVDERRMRRLTLIGVVALLAIGGAAWSATLVTAGAARSGPLPPIVGGLEALLLVVFAASVQNLFVGLLGLRGSAGELLRGWSPIAWGAALVAVTFLFWHTLLNPQGDPATVLSNRNVQVTLGLVGVFTVVTVTAWVVLRLATSRASVAPPIAMSAPPTVPTAGTPVPPAWIAPVPVAGPVSTPWATPAPGPVVVPAGGPTVEVSIATADQLARGRAWFQVTGGWVTTRTELLDLGALKQFRAFAGLSLAAWLVPLVVWVGNADRPRSPAVFAVGVVGLVLAWLVAVIAGRLWLERYRVVHTVTFPLRSIVKVDVGRDWNLGCALTILLSPLIGLLYLAFAGGRVVKVVAPFAADRPLPVSIRLKGGEAEGRYLRDLLLGLRAA